MSRNKNLYNLDKYQTKAVLCNKKSYLVVAGAGSGKTLTIVSKVRYLINQGVNPNKILCISFTNETVNSLKNRLNYYNINIDVKTFHKLSLDIIGESRIASSDLLNYVIEEFFASLIYFDNSYKLLEFIDNIDNLKDLICSFINQMKSNNYSFDFLLNLLNNSLLLKFFKFTSSFLFLITFIFE